MPLCSKLCIPLHHRQDKSHGAQPGQPGPALGPITMFPLRPLCHFHHQMPHHLSIFCTHETLLQKGRCSGSFQNAFTVTSHCHWERWLSLGAGGRISQRSMQMLNTDLLHISLARQPLMALSLFLILQAQRQSLLHHLTTCSVVGYTTVHRISCS